MIGDEFFTQGTTTWFFKKTKKFFWFLWILLGVFSQLTFSEENASLRELTKLYRPGTQILGLKFSKNSLQILKNTNQKDQAPWIELRGHYEPFEKELRFQKTVLVHAFSEKRDFKVIITLENKTRFFTFEAGFEDAPTTEKETIKIVMPEPKRKLSSVLPPIETLGPPIPLYHSWGFGLGYESILESSEGTDTLAQEGISLRGRGWSEFFSPDWILEANTSIFVFPLAQDPVRASFFSAEATLGLGPQIQKLDTFALWFPIGSFIFYSQSSLSGYRGSFQVAPFLKAEGVFPLEGIGTWGTLHVWVQYVYLGRFDQANFSLNQIKVAMAWIWPLQTLKDDRESSKTAHFLSQKSIAYTIEWKKQSWTSTQERVLRSRDAIGVWVEYRF